MSERRLTRSATSWLLVLVVAVTALAFGTFDGGGPRTNSDRTFGIARTVACPLCDGQSVAESDVAIAREIRADIARRVDAGESDDSIRQVYADRYGADTLLTPSGAGLAGLVWIIPVVGVVVAAAVLVVAMSRPRSKATPQATEADRALVERVRESS
jgi:cytochrome c-type biogenesis protein CcmH